jgi:hypothetical protein
MAQALAVDWQEVRLIALQVGVREAARQLGLNEKTVLHKSHTEGWMQAKEVAIAAKQQLQERQGVQSVSVKAQDLLRNYGEKTKMGLAKGLAKGAEVVGEMDGQEILMASQQVAQLTKAAKDLHDWGNGSGAVTIRLDVVAGQHSESPVYDIPAEVTAVE